MALSEFFMIELSIYLFIYLFEHQQAPSPNDVLIVVVNIKTIKKNTILLSTLKS